MCSNNLVIIVHISLKVDFNFIFVCLFSISILRKAKWIFLLGCPLQFLKLLISIRCCQFANIFSLF